MMLSERFVDKDTVYFIGYKCIISSVCFFQFYDLDGDGYDDLVIGAPIRTEDVTEELFGCK